MPKILLLNGPPKSGKDTLVRELTPYIKFRHMKFAMPIKRAVAALLDVRESDLEAYKDIQSNVLQHKDRMSKEYRDTPRHLLIAMSEDLLKPRYGDDFFGRIFWQHAKNSAEQLIVASDCGFEAECERVISNAGKNNCILVRIHRDGCSFDGDSRSFLRDGLCDTWDIDNNGTLHTFTMKVLRLVTREMGLTLQKEPDWLKTI
jgi:hypothetical protein